MRVFGMGEKKTPVAFISPSFALKPEPISKITPELIRLIGDSINDFANEDGWVFLGRLGNHIIKKTPDFDSRNFGYKTLTPLISVVCP